MITAQHSPLPFTHETSGPSLRYRIVDANGHYVAMTYGSEWQFGDAEFLVRAANNHEALVRMVAELVAWGESVEGMEVSRRITKTFGGIHEDARQLLESIKTKS